MVQLLYKRSVPEYENSRSHNDKNKLIYYSNCHKYNCAVKKSGCRLYSYNRAVPAVRRDAGRLFCVCGRDYDRHPMNSMREKKNRVWRCIQYSFIGFFYSGITPSATGGQPVQLYYMNKDGNRISDSTVVLMTVAVVYKFVLVVMGTGILIFWHGPLIKELNHYFPAVYSGADAERNSGYPYSGRNDLLSYMSVRC